MEGIAVIINHKNLKIMDKILTVVIPVYNTEQYLRKCFDSLIIKEIDKLEIVVIIDGSPDRSMEIAKKYMNKYPQTFSIINKENGGHGSCCNIGLKVAKGKYIRFLDSDDWFDKIDFPTFLDLLSTIDVDLIQCNRVLELTYQNVTVKESLYEKVSGKIWNARSFPYNVLEYPNLIHNSTFKTEKLRQSGIQFTEKMSFDDTALYILPYKTIKTIYCSNLHVYHYLIGREGQSVSGVNLRKMKYREHEFCKLGDDYLSIRDSISDIQRKYFDGFINNVIYPEFFKYTFYLQKHDARLMLNRFIASIRTMPFITKRNIVLTNILSNLPFAISRIIAINYYKVNKKLLKVRRMNA